MMRVTSSALVLILLASFHVTAESRTDEGITAFQAGRYSAAAIALKGATDDRGKAYLALTQAAQGNCPSALPALTRSGTRDAALRRLAGLAAVRCYTATGNGPAAESLLNSLLQTFPGDADLLYAQAKLHMKAFNDATMQMFQRTPASYRVHQLSAEIFEIQNRFDEAAAEYRKAIELNPKAPDLHFRLGRAILLESHEGKALDQAAEQFRQELALSPEDSATEFQLAQIAQVKGDIPEAKTRLQRALDLSSSFVAPRIALAKLNTRDKDYDNAIRLLIEAIQLQPSNESAHYALMTAYRDSGRMSEAKAEKAVLDKLQKPPESEFSDFLKKLGEKSNPQ